MPVRSKQLRHYPGLIKRFSLQPPRSGHLPTLNTSSRTSEDSRTIVVNPTMLTGVDCVSELPGRLEGPGRAWPDGRSFYRSLCGRESVYQSAANRDALRPHRQAPTT